MCTDNIGLVKSTSSRYIPLPAHKKDKKTYEKDNLQQTYNICLNCSRQISQGVG